MKSKRKNKKLHPKFLLALDILSEKIEQQVLTTIYHPDPTVPKELHVITETKQMLIVKKDENSQIMIQKTSLAIYEFRRQNFRIRIPGRFLLGTTTQRRRRRFRNW